MTQYAPADEAGIQEVVADAFRARTPLLVQGAGTKLSMLRAVQAAHTLSTAGCAGITLYAPNELIVSARAGTTLADLQATLAQSGQHMIAEPPDYSRLLGATGQQTLGGIAATNLSGPRRIAGGAVRDHVLGVRAVNGAGELIKSGGRVLKNVTGLDMCKLLCGSHGTLAVMTELTLKVLPAPEDTASVVLRGQAPEAAIAALSAALGSPYGVSGAAYLPAGAAALLGETGALTLARIEDFAASVSYRSERLRQDLAEFGAGEIWPAARSRDAWTAICDADVLSAADVGATFEEVGGKADGDGGGMRRVGDDRGTRHGSVTWGVDRRSDARRRGLDRAARAGAVAWRGADGARRGTAAGENFSAGEGGDGPRGDR